MHSMEQQIAAVAEHCTDATHDDEADEFARHCPMDQAANTDLYLADRGGVSIIEEPVWAIVSTDGQHGLQSISWFLVRLTTMYTGLRYVAPIRRPMYSPSTPRMVSWMPHAKSTTDINDA